MASGQLSFIIVLLSLCAHPHGAPQGKCPFDRRNVCTCVPDGSSPNAFRSVDCAYTADNMDPFDTPAGTYAVTGQLQITVSLLQQFSVPANAFATFKFINSLRIKNTFQSPSQPLKLDPKAFAGTQIDELTLEYFTNNTIPLQQAIRSQTGLKKLSITDVFLQQLGVSQFQAFPNLTALYVQANFHDYQSIDDEAFVGLESSLTDLSLVSNAEPSIYHQRAIQGLTKLQRLDLSYNSIQAFPARAFAAFPDLRELDLPTNYGVAVASSGVFDGISTKIERLNLDGSQIQSIPADLLARLPELSVFSIQQNVITAIRAGDFPQKNKLTTVQLDYNAINTIEAGALSPLKHVPSLSFVQPRLPTFDLSLLNGMETLGNLSITDIRVREYPPQVFGYMQNISVSSPDQVRYRSIFRYGLTDHSFLFQVPTSLNNIVLSSSRLVIIDPSIEAVLKRSSFRLFSVDLDRNNYFQCDESMKWMAKYVACTPQRLQFQNAFCTNLGIRKSVEDYLHDLVPNPCQ